MKNRMNLAGLLATSEKSRSQQMALFALLNLGLVESLANGAISAAEALRIFFHADNCLFVRKQLHNKTADRLMSHGVQLADVFELLPAEDARREFQRELTTMRGLCLKLLDKKR